MATDDPGTDGASLVGEANFAAAEKLHEENPKAAGELLRLAELARTEIDLKKKNNLHKLPRAAVGQDGQTSHRQPGTLRRGR